MEPERDWIPDKGPSMLRAANQLFSMQGKVALVTGASRGIGFEIARAFAVAGARVVICSRKHRDVKDAAHRMERPEGQVLPLTADVSVPEERKALVDEALSWAGMIDVLVNNAGANPRFCPLSDVTEDGFDRVINVNLKPALFLSQTVFKRWMQQNGGAVINMSSVGAEQCVEGINLYNVVKAGLNHLTRCLASEWGTYGVRVNALAPGLVKTDFSKALWQNPEFQETISRQPVARIGTVDDMVGAALLLATDASEFITGITLAADGGQLVKGLI